MRPHKYARVERERRFLLDQFPKRTAVRIRRITDRYIEGARLRLRKQTEDGGPSIFKLTQKVPAPATGGRQELVTTIYLTKSEYRLLAQLPATVLRKARYSIPPFGIDVFEGALRGLRLAEVEFNTAAEARALAVPAFILHEVTADERFTGGNLAYASRRDLKKWLADYGINLSNSPAT
jgi:CYTH domain-containing protein